MATSGGQQRIVSGVGAHSIAGYCDSLSFQRKTISGAINCDLQQNTAPNNKQDKCARGDNKRSNSCASYGSITQQRVPSCASSGLQQKAVSGTSTNVRPRITSGAGSVGQQRVVSGASTCTYAGILKPQSGQPRVVSGASAYTLAGYSTASYGSSMTEGVKGLLRLLYVPFQCCQKKKVGVIMYNET